MHINRLIDEKSPYLLQHAHNPVDWLPWGTEAFEKARSEDKPIFLSVGYSTCHWCHVMERESFENEEIAEVLNRYFVPVKVDREERPDVDRIYMTFVQATSGGGGWPMSVWLTPDLRPFFGGTYFPPDNRYGRPGFKYVLEQLAAAWRLDRARIVQSAGDILQELRKHIQVQADGRKVEDSAFDSGFFAFRRMFDTRLGGFGGAPKFPRPVAHNFLLRYYKRTRNTEALDMVLLTLREMAKGGMNDQLGGGFHRYSVDEQWFVPHFEKMLYDQAQLAISYLEAFQITGDAQYADEARRIFDYVLRDMTHPEGGFYSAEDADSVIDPAKPDEKGEGAFYIWSHEEIVRILGSPAAEWFSYAYGVEEGGNVRNDPHHEFVGRNILYRAHTADETARNFGVPVEQVAESLEQSRKKLLEARSHRIRPHLDDKILTAWNGLMISAFAKGAQVLGDDTYLNAARRAAGFVLSRLYRPGEKVLLRRFREGEASIPGFLDDYAFFAQALLDLYETVFELQYLNAANDLTLRMQELFEDCEHGAFYSTSETDESLVLRMKDDYDGAEPSGNSIAVMNLLRLAHFTGNQALRESAERALHAFASRLNTAGAAVPQMLVALDFSRSAVRQVILVGPHDSAETRQMLSALRRRFLPHMVVMLIGSDEEREQFAALLPATREMHQIEGRTTAYVCKDYACELPVNNVDQFVELLQ